jgi:hypothetical protein
MLSGGAPPIGLTTPKGPASAAVRAPSVGLSASKQERLEALRNERLRIMQAQASLLARPRSVGRSAAGTPFGRSLASPPPTQTTVHLEEIEKLKTEIRQLKINEEIAKERIRELEAALRSDTSTGEEVAKLKQQLAREKDRVFTLATEKQRLEEELQESKIDKFRTEQLENEVKALKHQAKEAVHWKEERENLTKQLETMKKDNEVVRNQYKTEKSQRLVLAAKVEQLEKDLRDSTFERRPTILASETVGVIAWKGSSPKSEFRLPGVEARTASQSNHRQQDEDVSPRPLSSSSHRSSTRAIPRLEELEPKKGSVYYDLVGAGEPRSPNVRHVAGAATRFSSLVDPSAEERSEISPRQSHSPRPTNLAGTVRKVASFVDPFAAGEGEASSPRMNSAGAVRKVASFVDPFAAGEADEFMETPARNTFKTNGRKASEQSFIDVEQRGSARKGNFSEPTGSAPNIASIFGSASNEEPMGPTDSGWGENQLEEEPKWQEPEWNQVQQQPSWNQPTEQVQQLGWNQRTEQAQQPGWDQRTEQVQQPGWSHRNEQSQPTQWNQGHEQQQQTQWNHPPEQPQQSQWSSQPTQQQVQWNTPQSQQGQWNSQRQAPAAQWNQTAPVWQASGPSPKSQQPLPYQPVVQQPPPAPVSHAHPIMKQTIPGRPSPLNSPKAPPAMYQSQPQVPQQMHPAFARTQTTQPPAYQQPNQGHQGYFQGAHNQAPNVVPNQFNQHPNQFRAPANPQGPFRY